MLPGGQSVAGSALGPGDADGLVRGEGVALVLGVATGRGGAGSPAGAAPAGAGSPAAWVVATSAEAGDTSGLPPPPRKARTTTSRRITLRTARTDMRRRQ